MNSAGQATEPAHPHKHRLQKLWAWAAGAWLIVVLVIAAHQWQFWTKASLSTDVLALLPAVEQSPELARASQRLRQGSARELIILIGAPSWGSARAAAQTYRATLQQKGADLLRPVESIAENDLQQGLAFYQPARDKLLTQEQRQRLQSTAVPELANQALAALHQPTGRGTALPWVADPLNLWSQWWAARVAASEAVLRDGELSLSGDGYEWVVLRYQSAQAALAASGEVQYAAPMQAAQQAATTQEPKLRVLATGLPLYAEAAAAQASREINIIGWGSLAAIVLLVWLAFRSVGPVFLVAVSLIVGTAAALSVTAWVFDEVHLITLVFGASLVGVAEDYGIHYLAARQAQPQEHALSALIRLLPGLGLALVTSVIAYLALGLAPFPGLRQMAVFSATGLVFAFLTVACWFPWLSRPSRASAFAKALGNSLLRWPRWRASTQAYMGLALVLAYCVLGLVQLRAADSLLQLQHPATELKNQQAQIARLFGQTSVAQFFVVQGDSVQQVLQREEALKARLDQLIATGQLRRYQALSDWLPSRAQQEADAQLSARVEREVLAQLGKILGETLLRPQFSVAPLELEAWLQSPASIAARDLWLGQNAGSFSTVLRLQGVEGASALPQLAALADQRAGVVWVDRAQAANTVLARYRNGLSTLLVLGHLLVFAAVFWRYRGRAWRVCLPTALASLIALATLGWLGQPVQLFNVLALTLLLGVGIDYSIFLQEHPGDQAAWLAVVMGAASTGLAFGLLAFSSTPALHTFGLSLGLGVLVVCLVAPLLRPAVTVKGA